MPQFYFEVTTGAGTASEDEAVDLPSLEAARAEAMMMAAEMAKEGGAAPKASPSPSATRGARRSGRCGSPWLMPAGRRRRAAPAGARRLAYRAAVGPRSFALAYQRAASCGFGCRP